MAKDDSNAASSGGAANPTKQPPIKLSDEDIGFKYVEFPEDVFFMESLSQNDKYDPNVAYVPVQRHVNGKEESHVYSFRANDSEATHVAGPVSCPDGSEDVTIFGSALSNDGWLYLCAFNRNSILAFDLKTLDPSKTGAPMKCQLEYEGVPSPNDVCIDPQDPTSLYVCAGTFRNLGCVDFSNAAYGQIYVVNLSSSPSSSEVVGKNYNVQLISTGHKTLAGCEIINGVLWIAQLFNMFTMKQAFLSIPEIQWTGNDAEDMVWMADNIDIFDEGGEDAILCPAYTRVPKSTVENFMTRPWLSSTVLFFVQLVSACLTCEPLSEAFRDPEVALAFSNTFVKEGATPEPVRLIFIKQNGQAYHFEVDLKATLQGHPEPRTILARDDGERFIGRAAVGNTTGVVKLFRGQKDEKEDNEHGGTVLGKRNYFNEQVTHAAHVKDGKGMGYIACVNFEQPRILLLEDKVFREKMSGGKEEEAKAEEKK